MTLGIVKTVIKLCGIRVTTTQRMGIVSGKAEAIGVGGELIQIRDSTVSSKIRAKIQLFHYRGNQSEDSAI